MSKTDFNQATLYISARSPFARRVRLALLENEIPFIEKVYDVFKPEPELIAVNPLARVPALQLKSGEVLIDSNLILQCLYENIESPLKPRVGAELLASYRWSSIGAGLCEKVVEYFLETLRPEPHRDPEVAEELRQISGRVLAELEALLNQSRQGWLVGAALTQADLDVGSALAYLNLRYSTEWMKKFPETSQYLARLEKRDSFQKTRPVAATKG